MSIDRNAYAAFLHALYREQLALTPSPYLQAHSATRGSLLRQVQAAELYFPYLTGRVLDWGCFHAPDACLMRRHLGDALEIHGCDIHSPSLEYFSVFHRAAQFDYRQSTHPYHVPYEDDYFDVVVADGVLEHVPNDDESLKELFRVLKPDGLLVVSCLPNAWSYLESTARMLGMPHHLRRYTMGETRSMLLHHGFEPVLCRHLQMMPTLSGRDMLGTPWWLKKVASGLWAMNSLMEHVWPVNRLATNLFVMARKRAMIHWKPETAAQKNLAAMRRAA